MFYFKETTTTPQTPPVTPEVTQRDDNEVGREIYEGKSIRLANIIFYQISIVVSPDHTEEEEEKLEMGIQHYLLGTGEI